MRQLVGCKVQIETEGGTVVGKLCHVGSNFVELLVKEKVKEEEAESPVENEEMEDLAEEEMESSAEEEMESEEEEESVDMTHKKRKHKCYTDFIPMEGISQVKVRSRCKCRRCC
ncbi:hypothetical protein [Halobacillus locisalis]|uniref:hypothetical protein n=1 Tax=Halobacillus locisalis TaxID=220753 RepID=UPI001C6751B1|nr:hypothetical protein [Halobacillus locisalis]